MIWEGSRLSNGKNISMEDWVLSVLATVVGVTATLFVIYGVVYLVQLVAG